MPPAVARELSITYGSYVVGGTQTNRLLNGNHRITRGYSQSSISFEAVVWADTEANFKTECAAFEAAFRTPWQPLTVTLGAQNLIAVTHTGNTGFNANPSVSKTGGEFDTGRSRLYSVSIEFTEPADLSGQSGRRTSTVEQSYDASRKRTVTISGTYTALGGNSARAQYESASPTFFAAVLSGLGGTFEKVSERADHDTDNKELSFSVQYDEVIFNQASGVLDHSAIVQPQINVSFSRSSPGDSPDAGVIRLSTVTVSFESSVDKSVTTDLDSLYENTVKPYLIQLASNVGGGVIALVDENFNFNRTANQISATLTIMAAEGTNLEYDLITEVNDSPGRRIIKTWSGGAHDAHVVRNPAVRRRVVTERIVKLAADQLLDPTAAQTIDIFQVGAFVLLAVPPDGGDTGWVTIEGSLKQFPKRVGHGVTFLTVEYSSRFEQEWVDAPGSIPGGTATIPGGGG